MNATKIVLSVERTPCASLDGMLRSDNDKVLIPSSVKWEKIEVRQFASLAIAEKVEDKVHLFTSTLKFYTCEDFNDRGYYAYRLRMSNGKFLLLGREARPFPVMTISESSPTSASENQWKEVSVTYTSSLTLPQIAW